MFNFKKVSVWLLVVVIILGQIAFATPGKDQSDDKGDDDSIRGFSWMNEKKILLGSQTVTTDLPPVIKEGRTLIPVRAVAEALLAKVEWDGATGIVTVTNQEGTIVIKFYLRGADAGKVTVTENGVTRIATVDSRPGKINNRTYVPLRFIAETFGLKVDDSRDGVHLNQQPTLMPKEVKYFAQAEVPAWIEVKLMLNGYSFTGIKDMPPAYYTFDGINTVKIDGAYILGLNAYETKLFFQFQKGNELELKDFEIELEYLSDDSSQVEPKINPDDFENPTGAIITNLILNGFDFSGILYKGVPLREGVDFTITDNLVTLSEAYVTGLTVDEAKLYFFFNKDGRTVTRKLEIEFDDKDANDDDDDDDDDDSDDDNS